MMQVHPIAPLYDAHARILILGSFPSVKSREGMFFYHHPQNRFWQVLAAVFQAPIPETVAEKKALLLEHGVALWDVIASCEIEGSSDASITNVTPTDLSPILRTTNIQQIFCNGTAAWTLYEKYQHGLTGLSARKLPSTSPANARWRLPELISAWSIIKGENQDG